MFTYIPHNSEKKDKSLGDFQQLLIYNKINMKFGFGSTVTKYG